MSYLNTSMKINKKTKKPQYKAPKFITKKRIVLLKKDHYFDGIDLLASETA